MRDKGSIMMSFWLRTRGGRRRETECERERQAGTRHSDIASEQRSAESNENGSVSQSLKRGKKQLFERRVREK